MDYENQLDIDLTNPKMKFDPITLFDTFHKTINSIKDIKQCGMSSYAFLSSLKRWLWSQ